MRAKIFRKNSLVTSAIAAFALILSGGAALADSVVSLTAAPTSTALPDGQVVPMWGYTCGAAAASGVAAFAPTCAAANPNAGLGWSPVVITVPPGNLTINLTNNLSFATGATTAANNIPTSLAIVGQLGGGLGLTATTVASPNHPALSVTWPIAGSPTGPQFTPPAQGPRVQSFLTEVPAVAAGTVATPAALVWNNLKPGTYLIESGTHPSIQGPMGLYGILVVTTEPSGTTAGTAYPATATGPAVTYNAEVPLLLSEIDPVQNAAVAAAVATAGFSETRVWSGQPGGCGNPASTTYHTCYPPAVNYDPRYYMVNGVSFDRTGVNAAKSLFAAAPASGVTGTVLVRFVNAGLRTHVPAIVGAQTTDSTNAVVNGFSLIAEDGNVLPGSRRIQNEVLLPAGKAYDVMMNAPASGVPALPVYDRQLSLSTNNQRNGGMQAYVSVNGSGAPAFGALNAVANPDTYYLVASNVLAVPTVARGVMANDVGVYGVTVLTPPAGGTLNLNANGTFTYTPNAGTTSDSFSYCANGSVSLGACSSGLSATVTLSPCTGTCLGAAPTANTDAYISNLASRLQVTTPGVLANDVDPSGLPLTAQLVGAASGGTVTLNADGSFVAVPATPPVGAATATITFQYSAVNSQHTLSTAPATVTVTFKGGSGLAVAVQDGPTGLPITDYRWIIEEDRTMLIDPACQVNSPTRPATCPPLPVPALGTNFHTSNMPVIASGCVGTVACEAGQTVIDPTTGVHVPAVCDVGNGTCEPGTQQVPVDPSQVALDPTKRYFISILPGDSANPFISGAGAPVATTNGQSRPFSIAQDCGPYVPGSASWAPGAGKCGHGMGGAPITSLQIPSPANGTPMPVNVTVQQTPLPTAKIAVFVFEDDQPLNGENDAGGGVDVLAVNEPGLGGFAITLFDQAGQLGDATGQITYDMFNMPVSNSLAGTIDPNTGLNACPIAKNPDGLVGMIVTCPKYESDGVTLSPLQGEAVIANLYPGLYEVVANPGAERIAAGEEWLQTNTLDGTKPHEAFIKPGEPAYFQEFGPAGFHVSIGFANPAIINGRKAGVCANQPCNNNITARVTTTRLSRTPDQRLYSSGSYDANGFTQCYASLGDPDDEDFAFAKCNPDGTFTFSGIPDGNWRITIFDQWNDLLVDGLSTPVAVKGGQSLNMGDIPMQHWRTNVYTRTFDDLNGDGVSQATEPGLSLVPTNIRFRDGSIGFFNNTDLNGYASFNEVFPFANWLVLEADTTRYKQTGVHVVYDAGGPADGTPGGGSSSIAAFLANSSETFHLPANLRFPGSVYCADADCTGLSILNGPGSSAGAPSTGRIDPPWVTTEAWQGLLGQAEFVEFGKAPYAAGENGGIKGEVVYASTRPFDDPSLLLHLSWEPNVPHVTINLYKKGTAPDGTDSLTLVDTTQTSSWDDWAQGFRSDGMPNMNCPGQDPTSPFYFTLQNSTQWLNPAVQLPNNSQYKCYDGWAMLGQVQPAPYDGMYQFPSVTGRDPATGKPTGSNCNACVPNPVDATPMLPAGTYVVEVIVPPGYELVKEEDKNILIGDNYIAPVSQQFAGLGNVFIMPDQAAVNSAYNPNNPQNPTSNLGSVTFPRNEGDTGMVESYWPCVGATRIVPDFISLYPGSQEVAPFAGASRNLCDRKQVTLADQMGATAKFYIFSSTHVAAHFTGIVNDDFASEFDPFSPQYGEKFAVPNVPISIRDWAGKEIARTYADQWGAFNGLTTSTWEVNPPNPTGYGPSVMVMCMNDPGPILDTRPTLPNGAPNPTFNTMITDPNFNTNYSNFCYEWSFMPGATSYLDTPIVPTAAFAEGYNPVDCAYTDATPAISSVLGDASGGGAGPWVSAPGHTLTINALGDQVVPNDAYSGPQATTAPFNQKFISRHYGFGATLGTVTIGGVNAPVTSWSDTQVTVTVPALTAAQSSCPIQQRGATPAQCGQLVITAANGQYSVDAVTVTIGGKAPTYIAGENGSGNAIQTAIDNATPGDLIIVGPGSYREMLLMWKPVRLQGVGAASVTINADPHPSGRLDPWRRQVNCLFGLALNGQPISGSNPYDPSGAATCVVPAVASNPFMVDRIPMEGIVGWDTTVNGNLAELLAEPTLMGAYEGAGITVLGKGVRIPAVVSGETTSVFGIGAEAMFPDGTVLLTNSDADCNDFPANFLCNPSRIDGFTITNSSQGGGGIFLHGWSHYLEISNNRIHGNAGTLSGGIAVGQGEFPDPNIVGDVNYDPGLTQPGFTAPPGTQAPDYLQHHVSVHNNAVTSNLSVGDELYSATPSAAGGVTFATGSDYYSFHHNWVCGNLSTGDGAGVVHQGVSYGGNISHNWILFNQSNNPTIPTHGGGIAILSASPDRILPIPDPTNGGAIGMECGSVNDKDCPPALGDGTGPGLVIDSNLVMGNTAESGSGGGIRLQGVNGTEVIRFPLQPRNWYDVTVTNNIIANNVAGWDGGGVSMQDTFKAKFVNNTVASNDTTASSGVLFNTLGAPNASVPPPGCNPQPNPNLPQDPSCIAPVTTSTFQAAGLVTMRNTPNMVGEMPATVNCPEGYGYGVPLSNGTCRAVSLPLLSNDLFWQNRAFHLQVGGLGAGVLSQQNIVTLTPALNQTATGQCVTGANYWDIGVRGDTGAGDHSSGYSLNPTYSILTSTAGYTGTGLLSGDPSLIAQYCNGARVPPEGCAGAAAGASCFGFDVPPGIADATSPNPLFNLTPAATVDEGNNWINMAYGPLSLTNPALMPGALGFGALLGDYSVAAGSSAFNVGTGAGAPNHDFYGNPRPALGRVDIGAVELQGVLNVSTQTIAFGAQPVFVP